MSMTQSAIKANSAILEVPRSGSAFGRAKNSLLSTHLESPPQTSAPDAATLSCVEAMAFCMTESALGG